MTETLRFLDQAPKWGYMSLNDATKGGGGFKKGWKSGNITRQTQKLVRRPPAVSAVPLAIALAELGLTSHRIRTIHKYIGNPGSSRYRGSWSGKWCGHSLVKDDLSAHLAHDVSLAEEEISCARDSTHRPSSSNSPLFQLIHMALVNCYSDVRMLRHRTVRSKRVLYRSTDLAQI